MGETYDRDGCYCLLIAVILGVNPNQARMLYEHSDNYPMNEMTRKRQCFLKGSEETITKEERRTRMMEMKRIGYSMREIADFFMCDVSTVRRNLKKADQIRKEKG